MNELLEALLTKLSRGDSPDSKYPDANGDFWALCPFHGDDHVSSFSVGPKGFYCFVCEAKGSQRKLAKELGLEIEPQTPLGCTLAAYADAKRLPIGFLRGLGLGDALYGGHPVIAIPYKDEAGGLLALRYRRALQKGKRDLRFVWRKGDHAKGLLYGLWRLANIREAGWVILVEGESDCHTAWLHDLPALGVPGAGMWADAAAKYLDGLQVYVWREPDVGGATFTKALRQALPDAKVLAPDGYKDLSDAYCRGLKLVEVVEQIKVNARPITEGRVGGLPKITITARHLRDKTADALGALHAANTPPAIFVRGGVLTGVGEDEHSEPVIQPLNESALRGRLARCANFIEERLNSDDIPVDPPLDVVRDLNALGKWPFPALLGIIEAPVIGPDGTVTMTAGYNDATRLFYAPTAGLVVPLISAEPTTQQAQDALALIQEIYCDFPFADDASQANALGTLLTPVLRPMIGGPVPLALLDKPQAGTGASLLAEVVSIIATGRQAALMSAPSNDEEWKKSITSMLLQGRSVITIDNIENRLYAPSLAMALTSTIWQDRILGRSETVNLRQRATWIGTGNNIRLGGDLPRRCYWIRMDAQQARPWQRSGFRHPHLLQWVGEQRGAILAAILTLARAWIAAGKPSAPKLPVMGSFEDWAATIGGVLANVGVSGFLTNLDALYESADDETPQWEAFLGAWHDKWDGTLVTVAELAKAIPDDENLISALPDELADGAQKEAKGFTRRLGKALSKRAGMYYPNGLCVKKAGIEHQAIKWRVSCKKGELGESREFVSPQASLSLKNELSNAQKVAEINSTNSPNSPGETTEPAHLAESGNGDKPDHACLVGANHRTFWRRAGATGWQCMVCHPTTSPHVELWTVPAEAGEWGRI